MRRRFPIVVVAIGLFLGLTVFFLPREVPRISGTLSQETYVWQRLWNEPVRSAVKQASPVMERFNLLVAEIFWSKGRPRLTRVEPDWQAMKQSGRPVGLSLRIGAYRGPFERAGGFTKELEGLSQSLVAQAREHGVEPAELQIDFDCAEARLAGYRVWVEALRQRVKPVPLTITALPSWLDRREFKELVQATDGFVLQVHALQRPQTVASRVQLCDPLMARRWVEEAARAGVRFKVALPTYSYVTAFNRQGRFIGASAEGPMNDWPPDVITRELAAEPRAMAELVQGWTANRPANMQGVIWYRLPVATDRWNWDWSTLAQVMQGRTPEAHWQVMTRSPEPGLVEVLLANAGEVRGIPQQGVMVQWQQGHLIASDSLQGTRLEEPAATSAEFQPEETTGAYAPGESRVLGWLRFDSSVEVHSEMVAR